MEYQAFIDNQQTVVETIPGSSVLKSEADALELVAACGEYLAERLLIYAENLDEDFYDLSTGLAGAVLLKFSTYRLKVAAVIPPERIGSGRFAEFINETNRGNQFRIFNQREQALEWLSGL